MKCLPVHQVSQARGLVLHDWHAEILALRSFNHFLIQECHDLARSNSSASRYIRRHRSSENLVSKGPQPFTVCEDVQIHMYCSEAPCGDASMELIMASQADATPWVLPDPPNHVEDFSDSLKGRGYFSELGVVRRKPCMYFLND